MDEKQLATKFTIGGAVLSLIGVVILIIGYPVPPLQFIFGIMMLVVGINIATTGAYRGWVREWIGAE